MEVGFGEVVGGLEEVVDQREGDVGGLPFEFELVGDVHHPVHQDGSHGPVEVLLLLLDVERIDFIANLSGIQETDRFRLTLHVYL